MKYHLFRKKISICGNDLMINLAAVPTRTYLHASHTFRQGLDSASKKQVPPPSPPTSEGKQLRRMLSTSRNHPLFKFFIHGALILTYPFNQPRKSLLSTRAIPSSFLVSDLWNLDEKSAFLKRFWIRGGYVRNS